LNGHWGHLKGIGKMIVWWNLPLEINLIGNKPESNTLGMTLL